MLASSEMKLRYTAMLVFVGWYLMFHASSPPSKLPDWSTYASYDTAKACESTRSRLVESANSAAKAKVTVWVDGKAVAMTIDEMTNTQCVATDDPRLAK
jgi:hypothetical protein